MPEVQEVFRMATQKIGPEPGALERQFRGQRRRSARRKGSALALAAALAIATTVIVVESARDAGAGDNIPADEGTATLSLRVPGFGFALSSDGSRVFALGLDDRGEGYVYDAATAELVQTVSGRGDGVVAFSPEGTRFVSVQGDPRCCHTYAYDSSTEQVLKHIRNACCYAAFSPDGSLLAVPQHVPGTSVFDIGSGERVKRVAAWGATAFSRDGQHLLISPPSSDSPKRVLGYVYDLSTEGNEPVLTLRGRGEGNVPNVSAEWNPWSADDSMIAIPSSNGKVFVWDAATGERRFALQPAGGDFVFTAFDVDGNLLAAASTNGSVTLFDLSGEVATAVETIDAYNRRVDQVDFGPGDRLMTAAWNRPTKVWDLSA